MPDYGSIENDRHEWKGPTAQRRATNSFWFIIFVIIVISWTVVGFYALNTGDVKSFFTPADSEGRKCGIDAEVRNAPFLLNFCSGVNSSINCYAQVCRQQCPSEDFTYNNTGNFADVKKKMICKLEINLDKVENFAKLDKIVAFGGCAEQYKKSKPFAGRCVATGNDTDMEFDTNQFMMDLKNSWRAILMAIGIGGLLSIGLIIFLQFATTFIVYGSIFFILILLCSLAIWTIPKLSDSENNQNTNATIPIICGILFVIIVMACVFLRKRINLACELIKFSAKAVRNLSSTLIFPIIPMILQLLVVVFAITVGIYLYTIGSTEYQMKVIEDGKCICDSVDYKNNSICDPKVFEKSCKEDGEACISATCHFVSIERPWFMVYLHGLNIFAFYWVVLFIAALEQMILAGAFAAWYWTFRKSYLTFSVVTESVHRTIRYHMGTAAIGSLLITICKFIRFVLDGISEKLQNAGENTGISLTLCNCYAWIMDGFLRILNRDAYIMCAIHGKGLFQSGIDALNLIRRNIIRFFVLNKITNFVLWMGKFSVTLLAGIITWYLLDKLSIEPIANKELVIIIAVVASYLISSVFFSVQIVAIDTIFLCFLEDSENTENSSGSYFMNSGLRDVLEK